MNDDNKTVPPSHRGHPARTSSLVQTLSPEQAELEAKRRELSRLQALLEEGELEFNTLQVAMVVFSGVYRVHIGSRYAVLDDLEAQIAELLAAKAPADISAHEHAKRAREQAHATAEETGASVEDEPPQPPERIAKFQPSDHLKTLRRKLSKLAHPDLAGDEQDRQNRTVFMQKVNEAFVAQDVERLELLLEEWGAASRGTGSTESDLSVLNRKIEVVLNKLKSLEKDIQQLLTSELYAIKQHFEDSEQQGRNILAEMCAELDTRISNARIYLTHLREQTPHDAAK